MGVVRKKEEQHLDVFHMRDAETWPHAGRASGFPSGDVIWCAAFLLGDDMRQLFLLHIRNQFQIANKMIR